MAAVQSSGAVLRAKKPFQTDHVTITGTMFQYQYMAYFNYYMSQVDTSDSSYQYMASYLQNYYMSYAMSAAADQCEVYATYAEAAHREGVKLDDADKANVTNYMNGLPSEAASYGYANVNNYLTAAYGSGVKTKDVKAMYELNLLCSKYEQQLGERMEDALTEQEVLDYFTENADKYITASYLGYSFNVSPKPVNSADYSSTEAYNAAVDAANAEYEQAKADALEKAKALCTATGSEDFTAKLAADGLTPTEGKGVIKANLSNEEVAAWIFDAENPAKVDETKYFSLEDNNKFTVVAYIMTKSASRDETVTKNVHYILNAASSLSAADAAAFVEEFKASSIGQTKEVFTLNATAKGWSDYIHIVENANPSAFNIEAVNTWLADAKAGDIFTTTTTVSGTEANIIVFVDSLGESQWYVNAKIDFMNANLEKWLGEHKTEYNLKVDLSYWQDEAAEAA